MEYPRWNTQDDEVKNEMFQDPNNPSRRSRTKMAAVGGMTLPAVYQLLTSLGAEIPVDSNFVEMLGGGLLALAIWYLRQSTGVAPIPTRADATVERDRLRIALQLQEDLLRRMGDGRHDRLRPEVTLPGTITEREQEAGTK